MVSEDKRERRKDSRLLTSDENIYYSKDEGEKEKWSDFH